jgi:hypothetical protein
MALESTQNISDMNTNNVPGGIGGRPAYEADYFTNICALFD